MVVETVSKKYIVAGRQAWNRRHFDELLASADGQWVFVSSSEELSEALEGGGNCRYLFFLHWSEKVPDAILENNECVCFHMTDVPFGRGGTPLQNLISRGIRETKLTALRMTSEFDAGPVYVKQALSLEGSSAEEIYMRASELSCRLAIEIASGERVPEEQIGEPVVFRRRKAAESELPGDAADLRQLHDHIRMLDAEGYPPAFLDVGDYRIEFSGSSLYEGKVEARVRIVSRKEQA